MLTSDAAPKPRGGWWRQAWASLLERASFSGAHGHLVSVVVALCTAWASIGLASLIEGDAGLAVVGLAIDPQGIMDIQTVSALPPTAFEPVAPVMALGHSSAARWFEVRASAATPGGAAVVVVQPSYLDDVRIYVPDRSTASGWQVHQQGDRIAFDQRMRKDLAFSADMRLDQGQRAFVRVVTRNALNIRVRLLSPQVADRENAFTLAGVGLYCGAVLVLALASALSSVLYRDRFWAANALFQFATLATVVFYFGLGNQFLFPDQPRAADLASVLSGFVLFFCGALLYRLLYRQYGAPAWLLRLWWLTLAALPVQLILIALDRVDLALQLNNVVMPASLVLGVCMVLALKYHDVFLLNLLRINMVITLVFLGLLYATHLGWLDSGFMQLYPGVFINLLTAVILHLVLLRRGVLLRRQLQLDQRELALIQQQVHIERQRREEDERFLSMLLHEIRSPLSVVALSRAALERKLPQVGHASRDAALRDLHRIEASVQQMREVLQQVQATSELEHRMSDDEGFSVQAALGTCEMSALLDRLVAEHIRHVRVDTLRLSTLAHGDRWLVAGGLERVLMMVRNLVNNALKYSASGSMVVLDVAVRPMASTGRPQCALSVVNQVGAVGAPDLQRLFEKYYRAPSAHQYSGSGLGLYWVRGIAQMLGGDVSCSVQGKEVTFTLVLPLVAVKPVQR